MPTNPAVDPTRLAEITALAKGSHHEFADGVCIMEAVSYIADEPWSDHPSCACPVIAAFLRNWNDSLSDDERNELLRPLIPRLVGTRGGDALEQRRATMATDWLIRVYTPAWLRLAKLEAQAVALEQLPEITDFAQCPSLMPTLNAVQRDSHAARAAAGDAWVAAGAAGAARAAAGAAGAAGAARAAAGAAAGDAARAAAGDAARAAAGDARVAAWAAWAAGAAAGDALKPTKEHLQQAALHLVERMIDAGTAP